MGTTTIRLSDELKARIAAAAERDGVSANRFIVEAITQKADADERRAGFHAEADRRWAEFLETGESIPWEEARGYFKALVAGRDVKRPVVRKPEK